MINYCDLDQAAAFKKLLKAERSTVKDILSPTLVKSANVFAGGGLTYNYAAKGISDDVLSLLIELAKELQVLEKYQCLSKGEIMNPGEKRKVLHHLCRGEISGKVVVDTVDFGSFYTEQKIKVSEFTHRVHSQECKGSTGKPFSSVVQIGIGGSDLGPRSLYEALKGFYPTKMNIHFISNVDPSDADAVLNQIDLETTLFILVSKSGTTQETLANYRLVCKKAEHQKILGYDISKHTIVVTSKSSPLAKDSRFLSPFFIDDFIGGRYSSTSVVGGCVLSLAFGFLIFENLLSGAHEADICAQNENVLQNAALLDALFGIYERNVLNYPCTAILPYSQALNRFPAHLQQLDMESNGKSVNHNNMFIQYPSGPIVFGEPGTNGQHSFYQLLHQGTDIIPLQFIGFQESQGEFETTSEEASNHKKLNVNLLAQIVAFALGKNDKNPNCNFVGNRPSSLLYGKRLDARTLGALLAHYENKVMFQGFLWNINSFDQEGVQLGKILADKILNHDIDSLMKEFLEIMKLRDL